MKIFFFLFCFSFASQGSNAFKWNPHVKKSGTTLYACANDTVIFPYLYDLSESESLVELLWTFFKKNISKRIGNFLANRFMIQTLSPNYLNKAVINKNGNFTMKNVNVQDGGGRYVLQMTVRRKDGTEPWYFKEFSLVVSENLMYRGKTLVAKLSDEADWNSDTESFSLSLTCGDFFYKNDNAPLDVEWVTPGGNVKSSTKYSDGKFYLQLDNPVKGGQYVCKISERYLSSVCPTANTRVTVNVDEDKARKILMESHKSDSSPIHDSTGHGGNAGDGFTYQKIIKLTKEDNINDPLYDNCAKEIIGGGWYVRCAYANLTALYNEHR